MSELSRDRLEVLKEWQVLLIRLASLEQDYISFALSATTIEEKDFYKGKIEMIGEFRNLPEELFNGSEKE